MEIAGEIHSPFNLSDASSEEARLRSLHELGLLDTSPEKEFDDLVELASAICDVPISLVSLVDSERQWFKAASGFKIRQTSRDVAFCSHAIRQTEMFVVEDATKDERFRENPLVTGETNFRFYAGVPLHGSGDHAIGTVCVLDTVPRSLTGAQKKALLILAEQVQARIDLRIQRLQLERASEEKRKLMAVVERTGKLLHCFLNNGPFISYMKDLQGRMLFYNERCAEVFGVSKTEWLGKSDFELWPAELAESYSSNDRRVLDGGRTVEFTEETPSPNGEKIIWKSFKFPCEDADGNPVLAGISVDITEDMQRQADLASANARLEQLARTDELTGLPNRRWFEKQVLQIFRDAEVHGHRPALLMLDADHFKRLNDTHGHAAGDQALRTLGDVIRRCLRLNDVAARLGGEEFCVVLPNAGVREAIAVGTRIQAVLAQATAATAPVFTVSIGAAVQTHEEQTWEHLLALADGAMYQAKTEGRDRMCVAGVKSATQEAVEIDALLRSVA